MTMLQRLGGLLPGLWAGGLLVLAAIATTAAFAVLPGPDAGRVVARMLAQEAYLSLFLGVVMVVLERLAARRRVPVGGSQITVGLVLALGTIFCTVLGYFGLQPMMVAARAGQGSFSFGQLHAVSGVLFGVKLLLVLALAWRGTGR